MEPKYVATRSALFDFSFFLCALLFILGIIPGVIYILYKNADAHHYLIYFYDDKFVLKSGILNKHEDEVAFKGVISVSIDQGLRGSMFDYGTVKADVVGKHNLVLAGVKDPKGLKKYLETRRIDPSEIKHVVTD